jgi:hypothetical protein
MSKTTFKMFLSELKDLPVKKKDIKVKSDTRLKLKNPTTGTVAVSPVTPDLAKKDEGNKTSAAIDLKSIMKASKRQGHTANVAHAVGIYPA